jgi:hypothetical protein
MLKLRRNAVRCVGLASVLAVLGCAAPQQQAMQPDTPASNGRKMTPLYDDTAYYNAVKDRWFGLGDYATDQPSR